jgi:4-amino-4-deoxy-L-arabinose transferase-like glycosyltransferase
MGWRVKGVLLGILILGTLLRLKGITNPLLDDQGWRQADTASMALNMLGHLGNFPDVLFPMLNYDGTGPEKVELEFPFLPYLLAVTWTWLGWGDFWGRLWAIFFSLVTIYGLYDFGRFAFSKRVGLWAAIFYAVIPLTTYYGRVVMPEPIAQAFSIWALNAILRWRRNASGKGLVLAGLLMSGAVLAKLPQLMIFPVALVIGFWPGKGEITKLLQYCLLSLCLPMLYYFWVHLGAGGTSQFVSGIISGQVVDASQIFKDKLLENLSEGFGLSIFLFGGIGLLRLIGLSFAQSGGHSDYRNKDKGIYIGLLLWGVISTVYIVGICLKIPLDYYLVPVALPLAIFASLALEFLNEIPGFVLGVLLVSLLLLNQMIFNSPKYLWNERYLNQAIWIRENTANKEILILSDAQPMTLYYSQRYGFRLIHSEDQKAWEQLQKLSGDYFVALPNSRNEAFWKRVEEKYPQIGPGVYCLKRH